VADEPVVVRKFRPVKAGNRLEEKTGKTVGLSGGAVAVKSRHGVRRGEVNRKYSLRRHVFFSA